MKDFLEHKMFYHVKYSLYSRLLSFRQVEKLVFGPFGFNQGPYIKLWGSFFESWDLRQSPL